MMESFRCWLELGLGDRGFTDYGRPKIINKKVYNKFKIPNVSTYTYEKDRGIANALESKMRKKMSGTPTKYGIPKYTFDVTQTTGTRLDPG